MPTTTKSQMVLEKAAKLAGSTPTWMDFSNNVFDQRNGLIARTFPDDSERAEFFDSPGYMKLRELLLDVMKRNEDGKIDTKSGKFVVRVPKTVHSMLTIEAKQEGVSMNQLVLSKLSASLQRTTDVTVLRIAEAFRLVHDGYSTDRVIVDPDLNARFLTTCRDFGLTQDDYFLNHRLFDIRKSKKVVLPRTTKRTQFADYDLFAFSSEIAVRVLQRAKGVSLDDILCDPSIRADFDEHAQRLAPEQPVLKLRCAALNLRKSHRLKPLKEMTSPIYHLEAAGPASSVNLEDIPEIAGAYAFFDKTRPVFASETVNLRRRLDIHFKHSSHQGLPNWLGLGTTDLTLEIALLPDAKQNDRLRWLQSFINTEKPLLNFQQAA